MKDMKNVLISYVIVAYVMFRIGFELSWIIMNSDTLIAPFGYPHDLGLLVIVSVYFLVTAKTTKNDKP